MMMFIHVISMCLFFCYSDTYFLGQRQKFNNRLNDTTRRYTYFVPRNRAWRKLELSMPSTIKKLFMPDFSYHVSFLFYIQARIKHKLYFQTCLYINKNKRNRSIEHLKWFKNMSEKWVHTVYKYFRSRKFTKHCPKKIFFFIKLWIKMNLRNLKNYNFYFR